VSQKYFSNCVPLIQDAAGSEPCPAHSILALKYGILDSFDSDTKRLKKNNQFCPESGEVVFFVTVRRGGKQLCQAVVQK